jgi:regulator of sigma E protease
MGYESRKDSLKTIKVNTNEDGIIGYVIYQKLGKTVYEFNEYSFLEAIPNGIKNGTKTLTSYVKSLSLIFNKEGAKQIGGFGSIGSMFANEWDWQRFWAMTALLSIILAFMNILPIPALDGGHVMFLIYEMIAGKPPSDQFLTRAQVVGMVLLFSLLIYANGMDLYRYISG